MRRVLIVMPLIMLGIFILAIWYTAFRLHVHFGIASFWVYQFVVAFVVIGSLALFGITVKFPNPFVRTLNIICGYVLMFLVYSGILLGIVHIAMNILDAPLLLSGAVALVVAFLVVAAGAVLGNMFLVRETKIKIPKLKRELTIMQISDAHIGLLYGRKYLSKIVESTNSKNPDFVVITGDLTETKAALNEGVLDSLAKFNSPAFFVEGNHDNYTGIESVLKKIGEQDIRILHNEITETHGIQLIGLDYLKADDETFDMHPSENKNTVKSVLAEMTLKSDIPTVLISHSPAGVKYAAAAGVDLMVSGHTHRGQMFPFSIFAKLLFPFYGGLYQHENTQVFVSGGVGGIFARMRLGSFNEINLLKLVSN